MDVGGWMVGWINMMDGWMDKYDGRTVEWVGGWLGVLVDGWIK